MENIEKIEHNGKLWGIVVRKRFNKEGVTFVTEDNCGMQVGVHVQKKGFKANPHIHFPYEDIKNLEFEEIFFVESGKIKICLYGDSKKKIAELEGYEGDIFVLMGGHSLECLEDSKLVEIKQGPYRGKEDKMYFEEE